MKELDKPTDRLPIVKHDKLFGGTLDELQKSISSHLRGDSSIQIVDMDIMYISNDLTLAKALKMIRSYRDRMKEDHPARQEFSDMALEMSTALIFGRSLEKEYRISRQRNFDLEHSSQLKDRELKEKDEEILRLKKQNETLIAGL